MSSPCLICKLKLELCLLDSVRERERGGLFLELRRNVYYAKENGNGEKEELNPDGWLVLEESLPVPPDDY
jgi:hypothetical protein